MLATCKLQVSTFIIFDILLPVTGLIMIDRSTISGGEGWFPIGQVGQDGARAGVR